MIQIVDKTDVAKRKPYRYSRKILEKMAKMRRDKRIKKEKMAKDIITINMLKEFTCEDLENNMLEYNDLRDMKKVFV